MSGRFVVENIQGNLLNFKICQNRFLILFFDDRVEYFDFSNQRLGFRVLNNN